MTDDKNKLNLLNIFFYENGIAFVDCDFYMSCHFGRMVSNPGGNRIALARLAIVVDTHLILLYYLVYVIQSIT